MSRYADSAGCGHSQTGAGLCGRWLTTHSSPQVNTNGPLVLFQATYALLRASAEPKFIVISSAVGSITLGANLPFNIYAYGASKAAVNWVARKLHHDFPDFSECELPEA